MNKPDDILALDGIPGCSWTDEQIAGMQAWWHADGQQKLVWLASVRYLGSGATREDIEDAFGSFYGVDLERSRLSYRPGGPDFVTYSVHVCFKRECVRRGNDIRKRRDSLISNTKASGEEWSFEERALATGPDPYQHVEQEMLLQEIACCLEETAMPQQQKQAFILKHYEQMSNEEIAWEMQAEVGAVRVWTHRAAMRVREHLRKKGWLK
jgi:RNA polymerase sigma factor (sigma-70 family)